MSLKQIQRDVLGANHIYQRGGVPFRWQISSLPRTVPFTVSFLGLTQATAEALGVSLAPKLPGWSLGLCRGAGGWFRSTPCPTPSSDSPTRGVTEPLEQPVVANENTGYTGKFQNSSSCPQQHNRVRSRNPAPGLSAPPLTSLNLELTIQSQPVTGRGWREKLTELMRDSKGRT